MVLLREKLQDGRHVLILLNGGKWKPPVRNINSKGCRTIWLSKMAASVKKPPVWQISYLGNQGEKGARIVTMTDLFASSPELIVREQQIMSLFFLHECVYCCKTTRHWLGIRTLHSASELHFHLVFSWIVTIDREDIKKMDHDHTLHLNIPSLVQNRLNYFLFFDDNTYQKLMAYHFSQAFRLKCSRLWWGFVVASWIPLNFLSCLLPKLHW